MAQKSVIQRKLVFEILAIVSIAIVISDNKRKQSK